MMQHPDFMLDMVQQRQIRVRAEIAMLRPRGPRHDPGAVRRQLGTMLIALGQRLVGSAASSRTLPASLRATAAQRA